MLLLAACGPQQPRETPEAAARADTTPACVVPSDLDLPARADPPDRTPDPPTSAYVLALSWSPEFCRFRADAPQHRGQCRDNRFGFVLHGLWPQAERERAWPRRCALAPPVGEALVRRHYCMMPSARLMQHEWSTHGTCGWADADAYFAASARAWQRVMRPNLASRDAGIETAGDIRDAFVALNPGLPRHAVHVERSTRGWLVGVRLCMDRTFEYRACPGDAGAADRVPVSVWRGG